MNISGTINALRLLKRPQIVVPNLVVPTFAALSIPLPFAGVRGIVLDKDNCFAKPNELRVFAEYEVRLVGNLY